MSGVTKAHVTYVLTVHDYIDWYLPKYWDLMVDVESELEELNAEAHLISLNQGLSLDRGYHPVHVWDQVFEYY